MDHIKLLHSFRCSSTLVAHLFLIPSGEEIKTVVFSLLKNKAPGSDGFTAEFFTTSWNLVGDIVIAAV